MELGVGSLLHRPKAPLPFAGVNHSGISPPLISVPANWNTLQSVKKLAPYGDCGRVCMCVYLCVCVIPDYTPRYVGVTDGN